MCNEQFDYDEFPARLIGGITGSYELTCDITSCHHAEFMIVSMNTGAVVGQTTFFVTGNGPQPAAAALNYVGAAGTSLNKDNSARGMAYSLTASQSIFAPMQHWERITDSQKKVYVRIDTQSSDSAYISIRFRIAKLKIIPGPSTTTGGHVVMHDEMHALNEARADATRQRLGLEKEIAEEETISTRRMRTNAGRK